MSTLYVGSQGVALQTGFTAALGFSAEGSCGKRNGELAYD